MRGVVERWLERRYGVDSAGYVYLGDLGVADDELIWHDPSHWLALRRALKRADVTSSDVFLDLGCGKGRALLVASLHFSFARVIGIEIAEPLAKTARANLARSAARSRTASVEVVTADVLDYEIPTDATIVYLFSPFVGDTFQAVLDKLIDWVDSHDRPLRVIYNFPFEHARMIASGRAEPIDVQSALWPIGDRDSPEVIVTYLIAPRDRPDAAAEYRRQATRRMRGARQWYGPYDPGFVLEGDTVRLTTPGAD